MRRSRRDACPHPPLTPRSQTMRSQPVRRTSHTSSPSSPARLLTFCLHRKIYRKYDGTGEIPESMTAVSWCDGDLSQIEAIKSMVDLYSDNNIIANKQNAARSGKLDCH